ncbi:TPA: hypothetical protein I7190_27680 [Vibrio vulnificus]|nr:hypothetical protein [Vibrio vulnificus]
MESINFVYLPVITAAISAVVAVSVVLLTQWFLSRRSKVEFLRGKLEELYLLVLEVTEKQSERYSGFLKHHATNTSDDWNSGARDIEQMYLKIQMYQSLYFRALNKKYLVCYHHHASLNSIIYNFITSEITDPEHDDMCQRFADAYHALTDLRKDIDTNYDKLISKPQKSTNEIYNVLEILKEKA